MDKKEANENSTQPSHFRLIALTPCIGKVFSSILKHRWLSFMVGNGSIDKNIQKAFMPGVPGCIEQSTKLAAVLYEAHTNNCVLVGPSKRLWQCSPRSHTL